MGQVHIDVKSHKMGKITHDFLLVGLFPDKSIPNNLVSKEIMSRNQVFQLQ